MNFGGPTGGEPTWRPDTPLGATRELNVIRKAVNLKSDTDAEEVGRVDGIPGVHDRPIR